MAGRQKSNNYVDNKEFFKSIVEYKAKCKAALEAGQPKPRIPNDVGKNIMLIANNLGNKGEFAMYTFKEEMIGDAIENCMMYFDNFNCEKYDNPFAYFTQIIYFAFIRRIQKEKKQLYTKYKMIEQIGTLQEGAQLENEDGTTRSIELYENMSTFIGDYEKNTLKKGQVEEPKKKKKLEKFIDEDSNSG